MMEKKVVYASVNRTGYVQESDFSNGSGMILMAGKFEVPFSGMHYLHVGNEVRFDIATEADGRMVEVNVKKIG